MKKSILILAAFAFVAFSCTKTEVKDDTPKKGINFSAYTAKPTKAPLGPQVDVITGNLEKFEVTAIGNRATYFDNVTFKKNTVWESTPEYFWPAFPLTFCAYNTPTVNAEGGTTFTRTINTSEQKLFVKPNADLAKQEDLVAAYAPDEIEEHTTGTPSSLSINFYHYLTQVIVKAKNSNSTYKVVVDGVKLANLAGDGTYTFSDNTMTATASKVNKAESSDYEADFTAKELDGTEKEVMTNAGNGRWYLIPQSVTAWDRGNGLDENKMKNTANGTYLALKVIISTKDGAQIYPITGSETAWMAVPVPTNWTSDPLGVASIFQQGKRYTIILDFFGNGGAGYVDPEDPGDLDGDPGTADNGKPIVGKAIKFNATVRDWDVNDVTITISL
ncbi:MAG: fimbrillin family protein [Candidatus Egerieousia sp.]|nr:fimbrillin family protein [Candidatus Egerieousia sp.]